MQRNNLFITKSSKSILDIAVVHMPSSRCVDYNNNQFQTLSYHSIVVCQAKQTVCDCVLQFSNHHKSRTHFSYVFCGCAHTAIICAIKSQTHSLVAGAERSPYSGPASDLDLFKAKGKKWPCIGCVERNICVSVYSASRMGTWKRPCVCVRVLFCVFLCI